MITFKELNAREVVVSPNEKQFMCYICEWFILMPPVFLNPCAGFVCGFCYQDRKYFVDDDSSLLPQKLYEDIVLYLRFPCKYCEYYIIFNGPASSHELQCSKRIFQCPISRVNRWFLKRGENCEWQDDDRKSMVAHVKQHHREYILTSPFQIRFSDIKFSEFKKHINIAILNNRKIISITTEMDEENKRIIFRCRSNKFGHPDINYSCMVLFESILCDRTIGKISVIPLGAKIMENPRDYCAIQVDHLKENTVFHFTFSPSPFEREKLEEPDSDDFDDVELEYPFC